MNYNIVNMDYDIVNMNYDNILHNDMHHHMEQRLKMLTSQIPISSVKYLNAVVDKKLYKDYTLEDKIISAKAKINEFIDEIESRYGKNCKTMISYSGGKDSCVLEYLVHEVERDRERELSNCLVATEVFHPETLNFIKKQEQLNINNFKFEYLKQIKGFNKIMEEDGYPIISKQLAQKLDHVRTTTNHKTYIRSILGLDNKNFGQLPLRYAHFLDKKFVNYKISHKCCDYIKGNVKHDKRPAFIGTTIEESRLRRNMWLKFGCNFFSNNGKSVCKPLSLWKEKDIWDFIESKNIEYSPIYKLGYTRSGCVCCMFGMSLEEQLKRHKIITKNRFELLYDTNRNAFNSFVVTGPELWRPLTDMGITLDINDSSLKTKIDKRKNELKNWYANFDNNFSMVLDEIEGRNPGVWNADERNIIFSRYRKSINEYGK